MQNRPNQPVPEPAVEAEEQRPWQERVWRPAGTVVAVALALLVTWHVISGQHGLSSWHRMRTEDRDLQVEIQKLAKENEQIRKENQKLDQDPEAIRHFAREQQRWVAPDEVIYTLPASEVDQDN
jgi:cell division protein FtsB